MHAAQGEKAGMQKDWDSGVQDEFLGAKQVFT